MREQQAAEGASAQRRLLFSMVVGVAAGSPGLALLRYGIIARRTGKS
jgi:hypothetical protein